MSAKLSHILVIFSFKALRHMSHFDDARKSLLKAQRLAPASKEIITELKTLEE